jgi:hypothetical protein
MAEEKSAVHISQSIWKYMPVLIRNDKTALFIHIPKTGGSSLEKNMADLGWREVLSIRGMPADRLKFIKASPQHFHAEILKDIFNFEKFSSIVAITRDPFNRLKSEYYWHFKNLDTWPDLEVWIKEIISRVRDEPNINDNHIRPQVDFLPQGVDVELFKLEDDGVLQAQIAICGGYEEKPKTLIQRLRNQKNNHDKVSKYIPEIEAAFAAQRTIIADFYAADYARFGYDPAGIY